MSSKNLIIVESPSKIKTLKKFLGNEYEIEDAAGYISIDTTSMRIDISTINISNFIDIVKESY